MKSTVLITAISEDRRYTAASSLVSNPTSRFGSSGGFRSLSASDRTVGPIFAAQPQVRASPVNVFFLKIAILSLFFQSIIALIPYREGKTG
jgi:hypothetical protein